MYIYAQLREDNLPAISHLSRAFRVLEDYGNQSRQRNFILTLHNTRICLNHRVITDCSERSTKRNFIRNELCFQQVPKRKSSSYQPHHSAKSLCSYS